MRAVPSLCGDCAGESRPVTSFLGVIVSSTINKSGASSSGNTVHVVVVKTDPGYQPNPGHDGTGTIVGLFV